MEKLVFTGLIKRSMVLTALIVNTVAAGEAAKILAQEMAAIARREAAARQKRLARQTKQVTGGSSTGYIQYR
jgi:hypothetical protein